MKIRSNPLIACLIASVVLAACAPAPIVVPATALPAVPTGTAVEPAVEPFPTAEQVQATAEAPTEVPQVVATSRGPNLESTAPSGVILASGDLQLVEFFRYTWGTCQAMAPMVHGLEAQYYGKIKFTYLDASDPNTQEFQRALGFRYQPEFYLLDGQGNLLQKWIGYVSQDQFEAGFTQYIQ